jgi:hypothetical protein
MLERDMQNIVGQAFWKNCQYLLESFNTAEDPVVAMSKVGCVVDIGL